MKSLSKQLITLAIMSSSSFIAHAADTTINLTGKVIAGACTISNSGSYNITLVDVNAATLNPANSYGAWKTIDVTLTNCPAGTTSVTATFGGTADTADGTKYANLLGLGFASNVSVQLQNRSGTVADRGVGSTMTAYVDGSHNALFDLQARPYSKNGNATAGSINSVVLMNFTYN